MTKNLNSNQNLSKEDKKEFYELISIINKTMPKLSTITAPKNYGKIIVASSDEDNTNGKGFQKLWEEGFNEINNQLKTEKDETKS